jgi:hypothetical protein
MRKSVGNRKIIITMSDFARHYDLLVRKLCCVVYIRGIFLKKWEKKELPWQVPWFVHKFVFETESSFITVRTRVISSLLACWGVSIWSQMSLIICGSFCVEILVYIFVISNDTKVVVSVIGISRRSVISGQNSVH